MLILIVCFVAVWTVYASTSRINLDRYGDMLENHAWGIAWQAGYFKHPPVFAWITAAWFSLFPRADWAYYLLSAVNAGLAVFASWRIALRFLDPWRAFLSAALFFFLPPITFLAIKYNANSALLPFWPLAVLFYLRYLANNRTSDAVLLSLIAAGAILVKYFSVALIAAICLHALIDREARPILLRAGTWVAALVFLAALSPHIAWLLQNDFRPVFYAASQGDGGVLTVLLSIPRFLGAILLHVTPAAIVLLIAVLRNGSRLRIDTRQLRSLRKTLAGRELLWTTTAPLVVVLVLATVFSGRLSSVWALPMFFSAPILLLMLVPPGRLEIHKKAIPIAAAIFSICIMALAPFIKRSGITAVHDNTVPVQAIAGAIEMAWSSRTDARLAYVAGDKILADGISFYASARPYSMQRNSFVLTPWITLDDVKQKGLVVACFKGEQPAASRGEAECEADAKRFPLIYSCRQRISVPGFTPQERWKIDLFIALPKKDQEQAGGGLHQPGFDRPACGEEVDILHLGSDARRGAAWRRSPLGG